MTALGLFAAAVIIGTLTLGVVAVAVLLSGGRHDG